MLWWNSYPISYDIDLPLSARIHSNYDVVINTILPDASNIETSGYNSCFVFGRPLLQISAREPTILPDVFCIFLRHSKQMVRQYLKLGTTACVRIIYSSLFIRYHAIRC
jgi:hypothetical protein